jgi:hypothetical protein
MGDASRPRSVIDKGRVLDGMACTPTHRSVTSAGWSREPDQDGILVWVELMALRLQEALGRLSAPPAR